MGCTTIQSSSDIEEYRQDELVAYLKHYLVLSN
jgi:hypothetical protein